jgi:hypothetical protein
MKNHQLPAQPPGILLLPAWWLLPIPSIKRLLYFPFQYAASVRGLIGILFTCLSPVGQLHAQVPPVNCINIIDFGVKPNSTEDCSINFQHAIDSAAVLGSAICIPAGQYRFSQTLVLKAGVALFGAGMGSNANQLPYNGSILSYTGSTTAIQITGTNTGLRNLTITNPGAKAGTGIAIVADSSMLETVIVSAVLIFGFTNGTALLMEAKQHGGLGYCSFYDLRIRHAKTGIHILESGPGAFVNSNSFFHGAISGGAFDVCLQVDGGDNNVFYGTVIEPYTSAHGHLLVNRGQIIGENIRIEATRQAAGHAVIYFGPQSAQSTLTGFFSGGTVINKGNNNIEFTSPNYTGETNSATNQLVNAGFKLTGKNGLPAYWSITNPAVKVETSPEQIIMDQNCIVLKVPPGMVADFFPEDKYAPHLGAAPVYQFANFSMLVKSWKKDACKLTYNYTGGLVSSTAHTGSGEWETIGLQAITHPAHAPKPKLHLDNTGNADTLVVFICAPSFSFGNKAGQRHAAALTSNGGIITGTLTTSVSKSFTFLPQSDCLLLPANGNTFIIDQSNMHIQKINYLDKDWFPAGTIITLLFEKPGTQLQHNRWLALKSDFNSNQANSSITLLSNGDGSWREVNRNN